MFSTSGFELKDRTAPNPRFFHGGRRACQFHGVQFYPLGRGHRHHQLHRPRRNAECDHPRRHAHPGQLHALFPVSRGHQTRRQCAGQCHQRIRHLQQQPRENRNHSQRRQAGRRRSWYHRPHGVSGGALRR